MKTRHAIWGLIAAAMVLVAPIAAQATPCVPDTSNPGVCYPDTDGDGVANLAPSGDPLDNCPAAANGNCDDDPLNCDVNRDNQLSPAERRAGFQSDWNHDEKGDACQDTDHDGVLDYLDNCRSTPNTDQNAAACQDTDHDTIEDPVDNCVNDYNPDQADTDEDTVGDACDICPFDKNPRNAAGVQDGTICNAPDENQSTGGDGDGAADESPTTPNTTGGSSEWQQGNGGCGLVPVAGASGLLLEGLAAIAVLLARRRRS